MTLDDLMEVWRSQDAAPLHGVNETLLRLALRQDEARQRKWRRWGNWMVLVMTALVLEHMARTAIRIYDDEVLSGWNYAIPAVGAAAALLFVFMMYAKQRVQAVRAQRLGDSLRDQINRQLAQLDHDWAPLSSQARFVGFMLLPVVIGFAMALANWRTEDRALMSLTFGEGGLWIPFVFLIGWMIICVGVTRWWLRRQVQRKVLPQKRRLEALLKELDGQ